MLDDRTDPGRDGDDDMQPLNQSEAMRFWFRLALVALVSWMLLAASCSGCAHG